MVSPWERSLVVKEGLYEDKVVELVESLKDQVPKALEILATVEGKKFVENYKPVFLLQTNKLESVVPEVVSQDKSYVIAKSMTRAAIRPKEHCFHVDGEHHRLFESSIVLEAWKAQLWCHNKALEKMMKWGSQGAELDAQKLVEVQACLLEGARNDKDEEFKLGLRDPDEDVHTGTYLYPRSIDMEEQLNTELKKVEATFDKVHPISYACQLLNAVASLHPFRNGNNRICHLCFAYGLARHGMTIPIVFSDRHTKAQTHYVLALQHAKVQQSVESTAERLHNIGVMALHGTLANLQAYL